MRITVPATLVTAALAASGCVGFGQTEQRDDVYLDRDECKVEGSDIGRVGATAQVGSLTVRFEEWIPKLDSPGEYVGFRLSSNAGSLTYLVKTGGEHHTATGTSWVHPGGNQGPGVPGISHVDFCESECVDEDDDGGGYDETPEIP
jgi:hypothetical protein